MVWVDSFYYIIYGLDPSKQWGGVCRQPIGGHDGYV